MALADRALQLRSNAGDALRRRRWSEAERELRAYLVMAPNDAVAWNNLGVALEHQRKQREAIEAYARATVLLPGGGLPGGNLIRDMQRYLGFAAAILIFKIIDIGVHFLPLPPDVSTWVTVAAIPVLILGAFAYYIRRRHELPEDTWRAYQSEMARTRRIRYGGIAFVFAGFLVFAIVLVALLQVPGGAGDGTVVLVIVAGLCWLIVARLLWRHLVRPFFESRME